MTLIDDAYLSDLKKRIASSGADDVSGESSFSLTEPNESSEVDTFNKIVRLVSVRDRSVVELETRLKRDGYDSVAIDLAVDRALSCGLLDDKRFAESLIRTRVSAGKGRQGIEVELQRNGIDPDSITGWPEDFVGTESEEIEQALAFLKRRPPTAKNKRDAAYRKLISKGYSSHIASSVARLWSDSLEYL